MINRSTRIATLAALTLALTAAPQAAFASSTPTPEPASRVRTDRPVPTGPPAQVLATKMHGRAAVDALGARLIDVAMGNGLDASRLTRVLTKDKSAWLSKEGRLFYQEDAPAESTTAPETASATVAPAYSTSATFALHSRASSTRKIFLDFDGATVANTAWNNGMIANGTHIGWDTDGSPSTFSTAEHGWIQEVWRQVAETYSPFDVDVTTQDPGTAGFTRSSSSDTTYGTHVVITSSNTPRSQACGTCLGIAYVGTFDNVDANGYYQPAWVFGYDPNFAPMIVAQAISHETGHTLGLHHDGTATASYYSGTAAWGPLMGSSRLRAVTQFSRGEYAGANNFEDDFGVIASNGLPLRADDYGSTVAAAEDLGALTSYRASGVIGTRADTDLFAVSLPCTTNMTVTAKGVGAQTTLDLSLDVLDSNGIKVAGSSPASGYSGSMPVSNGMDAQLTVTGASGTYYLRVDGVGNGSPTSGGWSDYGSLGQYTLTATGCPDGSAPPPSDPPPSDPPTSDPPTTQPTPTVTRPSAPRIGTASPGARGGARTAVVRWAPPSTNGGAAIQRYRLVAQKLSRSNRVLRVFSSSYIAPSVRAVSWRLPRGRYSFKVVAYNQAGASGWSASSRSVKAR